MKKCRFKRGINPRPYLQKNIKKMKDLSMRFIADLVHEKKQLVEKAEAILNEAEKAGGSLTKATQTK